MSRCAPHGMTAVSAPGRRPTTAGAARRTLRRSRTAITAAALVALIARGAWAQEPPPTDAAALQRRQAEAAAQLDPATASNEQLVAGITVLGQEVQSLVARSTEAKRSYEDAERRLQEIDAELRDIHLDIDGTANLLRQVAVELYVSPDRDDSSMRLLKANTIDEAQQRKVLAESVTGSSREAIEHYKVARARADTLEEQAVSARTESETGKAEQTRLYGEAMTEVQAQQRLEDEWKKRVGAVKPGKDLIEGQELEAAIAAQPAFTSKAPAPGGKMIRPVAVPMGDGFGYPNGRKHDGVDFPTPVGTPVKAALGGTIVRISSGGGYNNGWGNDVMISHGNGLVTHYAHLSRVNVSGGQTVQQGQVIALSGNTGHSTGPHLHFETILNGVFKNPLNYLDMSR
jgi:murein DD-endopeptidase MepM/ murein hydrolase activator NlpD